MKVECSKLWPAAGVAPVNHWGDLAGKLGASPSLKRPFLIGLRGVALNANETHQPVHVPAYDDTFVLLVPGEEPILFEGATHAYQKVSKLSPDNDGDGQGDVGSIRCGTFVLTCAVLKPHPIFIITLPSGSQKLPAHRDFDHDGVISEAEAKKSEETTKGPQAGPEGLHATAVLFHTGWDAPPGAEHSSSIACQTTNVKWLELMARKGRVIDYRLINAWDALNLIAPEMPAQPTAVA